MLLSLILAIALASAAKFDYSKLTIQFNAGLFSLHNIVTVSDVDCNDHNIFLIGFSDGFYSDAVNMETITAACSKSAAIINFDLQKHETDKLYLHLAVKSGSSFETSYAKLGCQALYELGGSWTAAAVSKVPAVGYCNQILTGTTLRVCGPNGWEVCSRTSQEIEYPNKIQVNEIAQGVCRNKQIVKSQCTEYGWSRIEGSCSDCFAGPFKLSEVNITITANGTVGDTVIVGCPAYYVGGPVIMTCTSTGWKNQGDCFKYSCAPKVLQIGDLKHEEKRKGVFGDSYRYSCPENFEKGEYEVICEETGWVGVGSCRSLTTQMLTTQRTTATTLTTASPPVNCSAGNVFSGGATIRSSYVGVPGETHIIDCPTGFKGNITVVCGTRGAWEIESGFCLRTGDASCTNTTIIQDNNNYTLPIKSLGQQSNQTCPEGYTGNVTFTCTAIQGSISWLYTNNTCVLKDASIYFSMMTLLITLILIL